MEPTNDIVSEASLLYDVLLNIEMNLSATGRNFKFKRLSFLESFLYVTCIYYLNCMQIYSKFFFLV